MSSKKNFISVIIVNYNGKRWLEICLRALQKQDYPHFEVIIVDNASQDGSVKFVKKNYPAFTLIENDTNQGFSGGNNVGLRKAKGAYIFLLNNDTRVEKNFLSTFISIFSKIPNLAVAQSKIVFMDDPKTIDSCGSFWTNTSFLYHYGNCKNQSLAQYNKPFPVFSIKGASAMIKRSVIDEIGLFDDDFWCYYEETDFCHRAWLAGYECWYLPSATVFHGQGGTSLSFPNEFIQFHNFKNKLLSFLKNFELGRLLFIIPVFLFLNILLSIFWIFSGKMKNSFSLYKAILWNIQKLPETMHKRKAIQKMRKIRDDAYLKKVTVNPRISYYYHLLTMQFDKYTDQAL